MMRTAIRIFAAIVLSFAADVAVSAQNDKSFAEFYRQRTRDFNEWRARANAEFADYLATAWKEFMVNRGKEDPVGPVPDKPVYYDSLESAEPFVHGLPFPGHLPARIMCVPSVSADYAGEGNVEVDFFGVHTVVPFAANMRVPRIQATEQDASRAWKVLSESDYMPTVEALENLYRDHFLNDWAIYTIIKKITDAVYIEEYANEKIMTQMFLLSQMQYRARVGASGGQMVLLLSFSSPVYQVSYISDGEEDFYIYSYSRLSRQAPLYTFTDDFSAADRRMDLVINRQMLVDTSEYQVKSMPVWSQYMGEDVKVPLNIPCVKFVYDYPQSDLSVYYRSDVDDLLQKSVFTYVKYKILKDNMDLYEAVGFVLTLVQKGFDYKTDYEMFGRAKPLFVEESFFYGANNCKDRVLVFSWITRELLGLDVVLLSYRGHVSCGVALPGDVKGDSFIYDGLRYVVCDPTYIGAPVGTTMPKYRGVMPDIVKL